MKKTRKHRKSLRRTIRGGDEGAIGKTADAIKTMAIYGISSILVGGLYLIAEMLNIPMSSFNQLSRKAFDSEKQIKFLHIPIHKVLTGCAIKTIEPDKFILQDDMYIHNKVAVVSCDGPNVSNEKAEDYNNTFLDSVLNFFGGISDKRQLRYHVFSLFNYIENIRETDEMRTKHIHSLIRQVTNHMTLIKCYLIYQTLKDKCAPIMKKKTILKDEDIVNIVNPYYIDSPNVDYKTRFTCAVKHLTKSTFDDEDAECKAKCKTCTFRNSFSRLTRKYSTGMGSSCRSSTVTSMINAYYKHMVVTRSKLPIPEDEHGVIAYLDSFDTKSKISTSGIDDETLVLEKFNTFMCKYKIESVLKEQIVRAVKKKIDNGYSVQRLLANVESTNTGFFSR